MIESMSTTFKNSTNNASKTISNPALTMIKLTRFGFLNASNKVKSANETKIISNGINACNANSSSSIGRMISNTETKNVGDITLNVSGAMNNICSDSITT